MFFQSGQAKDLSPPLYKYVKSRGPSIEPWGTPRFVMSQSEQLVSSSFMFIVNIWNCFSVTDEVSELQAEALKLWDEAGKLYMQENEIDLKDEMDFLVDDPVHYPPNGMFPSAGFVLGGWKNNLCV